METRAGEAPRAERLIGLDLARAWAWLGMLLVNFRVAMGVAEDAQAPRWLQWGFDALSGRAAALFVVLAGMGLALATRGMDGAERWAWIWRRSLFLAAVGLLNLLVFPPDIIHYYALYFWVGAGVLALPRRSWPALALLVMGLSTLWMLTHDYGAGWDWSRMEYVGLGSAAGFVRHLLFNGWHPVLPWCAFLIWGLWLQGLALQRVATACWLVAGGAAVAALAGVVSRAGRAAWPDWVGFLGVDPLPPVPLYMLSAGGSATAAVGLALLLGRLGGRVWGWLLPAGRMTLTLYLAHILIGMGVLEALGWLDPARRAGLPEVLLAALGFALAALLLAWLWMRRVPQGPLEWVMRRLTRPPRPPGPGA